VVVVGLPLLLRHLRHMPTGLWDRLARAQIWQGIFVAVLEVVCIALLVSLAQRAQPSLLDRTVTEWVQQQSQSRPILNDVARWGSSVGTLPAVAALTALVLAGLALRGRSWRAMAAAVWALVASEAIGLILFGLLRSRDIEPMKALTWPFGFVGLVPLRAMAVYGMAAALVRLQNRKAGLFVGFMAMLLILLAGFSVVWLQEQEFTEALLEYAAGGVILFSGLWWLEGFGPGLWPSVPQPPQR